MTYNNYFKLNDCYHLWLATLHACSKFVIKVLLVNYKGLEWNKYKTNLIVKFYVLKLNFWQNLVYIITCEYNLKLNSIRGTYT